MKRERRIITPSKRSKKTQDRERNIKKGERLLCQGNEIKFKAIAKWAITYSITDLCKVLSVSTGAYYYWKRKPAKLISESELLLYREAKRLFNQTRSGMGYVKLTKALNKAGFVIGETRTRSIMRKLKLVCTQRLSYKSTTNSNHSYGISENILNQQFNPDKENQVAVKVIVMIMPLLRDYLEA